MGMTAIGDPNLTYKVGLTIAKQLAAIGVTQMYSPVCDVNINPKNPEIGVRSFGDDPQTCAKHVAAIVSGYQDGGIVATAKHFPGRGDSATDAHDVLDVIRADQKRMQEVELVPFKAAHRRGRQGRHDGAHHLSGVRRGVPDHPVAEDPHRPAAGASWASTASSSPTPSAWPPSSRSGRCRRPARMAIKAGVRHHPAQGRRRIAVAVLLRDQAGRRDAASSPRSGSTTR